MKGAFHDGPTIDPFLRMYMTGTGSFNSAPITKQQIEREVR